VKGDIVRFFGTPKERIAVITAPPQRQFLTEQGRDQLAAARDRLNLSETFFLYPAHAWPHKNHLRLVEAFRGVVDEYPAVKLVLTGNTQSESSGVIAAIDAFGLNESVIHLGYLSPEDLQSVYQLATALVMPSLFESVSIPIYEAFQLGTPVAASSILAIPEQVGDAALLFDPLSSGSIKEAMMTLLRDPQAARALAARGRVRMAAMTPERYGAELQALLRDFAPTR